MKKIFFITLLLFLSSCGYNPIYLDKETNFSISKIVVKDKSKISYNIKNNLKKYVKLATNFRLNFAQIAAILDNQTVEITQEFFKT